MPNFPLFSYLKRWTAQYKLFLIPLICFSANLFCQIDSKFNLPYSTTEATRVDSNGIPYYVYDRLVVTNGGCHTGVDIGPTPNHLNPNINSSNFGQVTITMINGSNDHNFGHSIIVKYLRTNGSYVYMLYGHMLDTINLGSENYISKNEFISRMGGTGGGGNIWVTHLHWEINVEDGVNELGYTDVPANEMPPANRGCTDEYTVYSADNFGYSTPDNLIDNNEKVSLPFIKNTLVGIPSATSYNIFGYSTSPIQGYLNLQGGFDESTILVREKDDINIYRREDIGSLNDGDSIGQGNIGSQHPFQSVTGISGSNTYTVGDYFIAAYVNVSNEHRYGYPVKFSIVNTLEDFIIDNDQMNADEDFTNDDNGELTYSGDKGSSVPGYFLTADLHNGQSNKKARWRPNKSGFYRIWAHIPERGATATSVIYKVFRGDGSELTSFPVNQMDNGGEWVHISGTGNNNQTFWFDANNQGYVELSLDSADVNSGIPITQKVAFDAIKFDFIAECPSNKNSSLKVAPVCQNTPPNIPTSPTPSSNLSGVSVGTGLSWTGGDPDGDAVTYDVYLAANDSAPDTLVCTGVAVSNCNISGNLLSGTTYYWKVIASDSIDTSESEIWYFITSEAPNCTYTVIEPNGGEDYESGTAQTIVWSHSGTNCSSNVKIDLFNNGILDYTIESVAPNTDSYNWQMITGQPAGSNYRIRITDGLYIDESNSDFTITLDINQEPAPVIISPIDDSVLSTDGFNINGTSSPGVGLELSIYQNNSLIGEYCSAIYITGFWYCDLDLLAGDYRIDAYHYSTLNDSVISPVASISITIVDLEADIIFKNDMEEIVITTTPLNDTGITWGGDYPDGNNANCTSNIATPQDCHYGRDATHNDDSDGHAGFSFTKLDVDGTELSNGATVWSCVRDNVTGLIWEVKTDDGGLHDKNDSYNWYNTNPSTNGGADGYDDDDGDICYGYNNSDSSTYCNTQAYTARVNTEGLCGNNDWRLPDINELHSIAHLGKRNPIIDENYFPNTRSGYFWSSSPYAYTGYAWLLFFFDGHDIHRNSNYDYYVRLVRGGQ